MKPKTVVLVSGGLDSAVLLRWALAKGPVATLTFDRPDRPRMERRASRRLMDYYGIQQRFELSYPTPVKQWVQGPASKAWVPGRNLFQLSAATLLAARLGARVVAAGHLRTDEDSFPDAGRSFLDGVETLVNMGAASRIVVATPFAALTKTEVALLGRSWNVPLRLTWSCYQDEPQPCRRCAACRERRRALARAWPEAP